MTAAALLIWINRAISRPHKVLVDQRFTLVASSIMKQAFLTFARDVDAFCNRMNNGLVAVAIVLGVLAFALALVRAQQCLPTLMDSLVSSHQLTMEQ